ncbi:MAG: MFS transporter [Deltaproteobacteria bacterium]|nr:MFS transporter [Deltaproteobacteria bacterium]
MPGTSVLDRARLKAYKRLVPLVFISYVVAYVDRSNVSIAKLTMEQDLPGFDNHVFGFGAGVFFLGYFLLEIPGSLLVEKWSARKWISRIMVTWGLLAACTALVKTPNQFYIVRFLLGLAEAGFFPGVIVYLTHWFTSRDRARALAYFFAAASIAQITSPKLSNLLMKIGTSETINGVLVTHPMIWGLKGWQWVYIAWGIPSVVLGVVLLFMLTDRPREAKWLTKEEQEALELALEEERAARPAHMHHMSVWKALTNPRVLMLAAVYFCSTTANYGVEFFMPTILQAWYGMNRGTVTSLIIIPQTVLLFVQLFVGWNSDRTRERWWHTATPILVGGAAMALAPWSGGQLWFTMLLLTLGMSGFRGHMPAFWSLPSLFLTEAAAAGSIGLINSVGNLGGFLGPYVMGTVQTKTGSFAGGIYFLCFCAGTAGVIMLIMRHLHRRDLARARAS